jgi:hypothetical protein
MAGLARHANDGGAGDAAHGASHPILHNHMTYQPQKEILVSTLKPRSTLRLLLQTLFCGVLVASVLTIGGTGGAWAQSALVVSQCDEQHLVAAFAAVAPGATATITFTCDGTITLTSTGPTNPGTLVVTNLENITLDGSGHNVTIDGGRRVSLFFVAPRATLHLEHLTLAHGSTRTFLGTGYFPYGGAVTVSGTLTADYVDFVGNQAFDQGGAIWMNRFGSVTISHSTFRDNYVSCTIVGGGGGAISDLSHNPLVVTDSTFIHNSTVGQGAGGAIYAAPNFEALPGSAHGPITVSRSYFENNIAILTSQFYPTGFPLGGGAIGVYGHPLAVDHSQFSNNAAVQNRAALASNITAGGAISFAGDQNGAIKWGASRLQGNALTITDSTFWQNQAVGLVFNFGPFGMAALPSFSGAVHIFASDPSTIARSTFVANSANIGGTIVTFSPLSVTDSLIAKNFTTSLSGLLSPDEQRAGGVLAVAAPVTFTRSRLMGNRGGDGSCHTESSGTIIDGGGNTEQPGHSCGFGSTP